VHTIRPLQTFNPVRLTTCSIQATFSAQNVSEDCREQEDLEMSSVPVVDRLRHRVGFPRCSGRLYNIKWLSDIAREGIRKVFFSLPSPPPDVESIQACLAIKIQEVERLTVELAEVKAVIATTLPAKERQICDLSQKISHLLDVYRAEVAEHHMTRSDLQMKDAEIRRLKEHQVVARPSPSPFTISSTSNSNSASVFNGPHPEPSHARARVSTPVLSQPIQRAMKRGAEIRWRGYGCPKRTAVPECTASNGYHYFSGSGTNQYAKRYTCTICDFSCSEK